MSVEQVRKQRNGKLLDSDNNRPTGGTVMSDTNAATDEVSVVNSNR